MSKNCSNCNEPTIKCGDIIYAPCVYFEIPEGALQEYISGGSSTDLTECINLDTALEELYTKVKELEETVDFSDYTIECVKDELDDEPTLRNVIEVFGDKICELDTAVENLTFCKLLDQEIDDCIDVSCLEALEDVCANPLGVTTWKELLVALTNKVCELAA